MADAHGGRTATPAAKAPAAAPARKGRKAGVLEDRVPSWPFLVRNEFVCSIIAMIILTVWSIIVDAPLEEPANPSLTPNPSKAPWYFLGLQEMLVYFDPWLAGVVFPSLIIVGLMVIPYIDVNPKGNGYYTFRERRFAISTYLLGFLVLWVTMIILGTFFRGPGWYLFWPWQFWDQHKTVAITNVNLPDWSILGTGLPFRWMGNPRVKDLPFVGGYLGSLFLGFEGIPVLGELLGKAPDVELLGGVLIALYYCSAVLYYSRRRHQSPTIQQLGPVRYAIVAFLLLSMMGLPVKIFLRLAFNIKYVWVTPWFNI